ncbi:oxidoreductase [Purpureocillium lilacinum]|uniref:Oxidoreductase n=1 Tax=Purpureocillium lilacinum TaxID=33203 RepID=A0A179GPY6_PURLI|nr:oxidoreductase [Purpureocillium lilacinum]OAQ79361.1 oxidoreductase [Purpureocillium lilacinum]
MAQDPATTSVPSNSTGDLLAAVSAALTAVGDKEVFAIGGKIPVTGDTNPIVVRWDSPAMPSLGRKVTFPVPTDEQTAFDQLCKDCEPAAFGIGEKEVFDEEYRKAGKMDESRFCSSFDPSADGVVDTIAQALLHGARQNQIARGVKAQLYKLNVYSAPSGRFKAHVDTPRAGNHMGSLVVCLPYSHRGGELVVRHGRRETTFDWSGEDANAVRWAAFFSDCEHEVLEVTQGHRVTLTYNLYWTAYGPALMGHHFSALELETLHFFRALQELLDAPDIKSRGATLGFTCTHAYPHTSNSSVKDLAHCLKGLDMVVYQSLLALAESARVTAVLHDARDEEDLPFEYEITYPSSDEGEDHTMELAAEEEAAQPEYTSQAILNNRTFPEPAGPFRDHDFYNHHILDPRRIVNFEVRPEDGRMITKNAYVRRPVTWLNHAPDEQTPKELAIAFIAYGNDPGLGAWYSAAAITAEIMPRELAQPSASS